MRHWFYAASPLEYEQVAWSMPDQIDIERQRHQFPPLIGELPEVLEQLLGVRAAIGPRQVPDIDGIFDLGHGILPPTGSWVLG
jgi:hypothetical protein